MNEHNYSRIVSDFPNLKDFLFSDVSYIIFVLIPWYLNILKVTIKKITFSNLNPIVKLNLTIVKIALYSLCSSYEEFELTKRNPERLARQGRC